MYCQQCGALITETTHETTAFCRFCGAKQEMVVQSGGIFNPQTQEIDISNQSVMGVADILYPIIEAEFAKKGMNSKTVRLKEAIRVSRNKKIIWSLIFTFLTVGYVALLFAGVAGIALGTVFMHLNVLVYILGMRDARRNNLAYIVSVARTKPDVPIEQIVAEEMMRV